MAPQGWSKLGGIWHDEMGIARPPPPSKRNATPEPSRSEVEHAEVLPQNVAPKGAPQLPPAAAQVFTLVPPVSSLPLLAGTSAVRTTSRRGSPRKRTLWWVSSGLRLVRSLFKGFHGALLLVLLAAVVPRTLCPDLGKSFELGLDVFDNFTSVFAAASQATVNVTTAFAQFTTSSLGAVESRTTLLWTGIDISDVDIRLRSGKLLFLDAGDLQLALDNELADISEGFAQSIVHTASLLSLSVPWLELTDANVQLDNANASGKYVSFSIGLAVLQNGFFGLSWEASVATFRFDWANPLWELLECSMVRQEMQILEKLKVLVSAGASLNPVLATFDPKSFKELSPPVAASWARLFKFLSVTVPCLVVQIVSCFSSIVEILWAIPEPQS